jgi:small subunit ribosomal protein S20
LAHSSRTWTGARTPSALKRVRQSHRRNAILQPRRTAAKTQIKNALSIAESGDAEATRTAVAEAVAALDRAAKVGAIHPNNAARRKSRMMRRTNAALGGESLTVARAPQRQVSKAAAAKAAKARIAASKASKAKGEQTAAGKARAALSKSARTGEAKKTTTKASAAKSMTKKTATKKTTKATAAKSMTKKSTAKKSTATKAKSTTKKTTAKKSTKEE